MARKEKPADALWAFLIDPHLWKSDYLGTRAKWKRPQRHMWLQLPPPAAPPCFTSPFHPTFLLRSPLVTIYCLSDGLFYVADLDRNGSVRQKHPARNNISHQIKKKKRKKEKEKRKKRLFHDEMSNLVKTQTERFPVRVWISKRLQW